MKKPFKMKGHTLPGINQRSEGNTDLLDGRSGSSPFQDHDGTPNSNTKTHFADGSPKSKRDKKILTPDSKLRKTENPDTWVYKGMSKGEKIADLEDRIEFLQGDIEGFGSQPEQDPKKTSKDLASLKRELSIIRKTGNK